MAMTRLPHRGVLEIQGEDKNSFLQGLISNDIHVVSPSRAIYATLLSPQGRFLYDFFIIEREGSFFLDAESARIEDLLKKLSLYKLRSQVKLSLRPDLKVFAIWGEDAKSLPLKEELGAAQDGCFRDPRLLELGVRMIGAEEPKGQPETPQEYDLYRLSLGIPEGGRDLIPDKTIPLEAGLDELHAVSWTKGCYMGQELTARTKYRGLVRKRLFSVQIEGNAPSEGAEVFLNEAPVGRMMTHAGSHGLALLRLEAFQACEAGEGQLICEGTILKPYLPFWMDRDASSGTKSENA
jgi:folate-binding protein YgfZ